MLECLQFSFCLKSDSCLSSGGILWFVVILFHIRVVSRQKQTRNSLIESN